MKNAELTGELGIKAYIGPYEYERAFAHNTWYLYSENNVERYDNGATSGTWSAARNISSLQDGIHDPARYHFDDLSYLAKESPWRGEGLAPMMAGEGASAKTELDSLLDDTYRNARPVMISMGDSLYTAFVRADAGSGRRYVAVTRYDGDSWKEPVISDSNAILDSDPVLCESDGKVYLAYSRTTSEEVADTVESIAIGNAPDAGTGASLLDYAKSQEIVVGVLDPDSLKFTELGSFKGEGFASQPELSVSASGLTLAYVDSVAESDEDVLNPGSSIVKFTVFDSNDNSRGGVETLLDAGRGIQNFAIGEKGGKLVAAYISDGRVYSSESGGAAISEGISGRITYTRIPGSSEKAFTWNGDGELLYSDGLSSSSVSSIPVEGITSEYEVVGDNIYYSFPTGKDSANLMVLQFHADSGFGVPIQLTDADRYLENLSVANLQGSDYVMGMHTQVEIGDDYVEDSKNLVWSRVLPVSNLIISSVDYDPERLVPGESNNNSGNNDSDDNTDSNVNDAGNEFGNDSRGDELEVALTVVNGGDHRVRKIEVSLDGESLGEETVDLAPGESIEIKRNIVRPSGLTEYTFEVSEPDETDYSPEDNSYHISIGHADAALGLSLQQVGDSRSVIAAVTNRGVEAAEGTVKLYGTEGEEIYKGSFGGLEPGGTFIATYELEGFEEGGEIFAEVELSQDEIAEYNNNASLYIPQVSKLTGIEELSVSDGIATAKVYLEAGVTATAYLASYDKNGRMLGISSKSVTGGEDGGYQEVSFDVKSGAEKVKMYILDKNSVPICHLNEVDVN